MDRWGFLKEWKWDYYQKNKDNHHNASQANVSNEGGGFGNEYRHDYRESQTSGGGFCGTTIISSNFGFVGEKKTQYGYGGHYFQNDGTT